MLPYEEIWRNILQIQEFKLSFNISNTKNKVALTLADVLEIKSEFFLDTLEYTENIAKIMFNHTPAIDYMFRYKDDRSIERNWYKDDLPKPLFKILNDILGMRFVLPVNREELGSVIESFRKTCPLGEEKCRTANLEKDGYHGVHLYIKFNNFVFPIEIQFWTRVDALLNQYLRDSIYTRHDEPIIISYANLLRQWLEEIPDSPSGYGLKSYVDYLYERAFQHNNREEK